MKLLMTVISPNGLKLANFTPIHKCGEKIYQKNYRPVSILPVLSKIYERVMQQQINSYIDVKGYSGLVFMDLSKAFETINHDLLIAKLDAFGFGKAALKLMRKVLFKTSIQSQFAYCPIVWMFHDRGIENKINRLHERVLRIVYRDDTSTYNELLLKDGFVIIPLRNIQLSAR